MTLYKCIYQKEKKYETYSSSIEKNYQGRGDEGC